MSAVIFLHYLITRFASAPSERPPPCSWRGGAEGEPRPDGRPSIHLLSVVDFIWKRLLFRSNGRPSTHLLSVVDFIWKRLLFRSNGFCSDRTLYLQNLDGLFEKQPKNSCGELLTIFDRPQGTESGRVLALYFSIENVRLKRNTPIW